MRKVTFNQDGYQSALLGGRGLLGGAMDGMICSPESLYAQGGLYARVVDLPADKAVSRGIGVDGDQDNAIVNEFDRLRVVPIIADALRWARLSGGAGIVILSGDGKSSEPLDVGALLSIEELYCFPLGAFTADSILYTDQTSPNYNQPQRYRVNSGSATFLVHETRIIPISGGPLPPSFNSGGIPWAGRSDVYRTYPAIGRLTRSLELANNILERKQQAIYSMSGLADLISRKMESAVQARINLVDSVRGVLNTVALDSEDQYRIEDTSLGGIKDVIGEQKVAVSCEAGIAITLLFGESPGGMNATGAADFHGFYQMVEGLQRTRAQPALERLISLILAQGSFKPNIENWSVIWPALETPSDENIAEVRNKDADSDVKEMTALTMAVDLNALSDADVVAYLRNTGRFGLLPVEAGSKTEVDRYANQTA